MPYVDIPDWDFFPFGPETLSSRFSNETGSIVIFSPVEL